MSFLGTLHYGGVERISQGFNSSFINEVLRGYLYILLNLNGHFKILRDSGLKVGIRKKGISRILSNFFHVVKDYFS